MTNTPTQAAIEAACRAAASASNFTFDAFNEATKDKYRRQTTAAIEAYRAAMREAGVVLVPVEPDDSMIDAGADEMSNPRGLVRAYRAMIAARPQIGGE